MPSLGTEPRADNFAVINLSSYAAIWDIRVKCLSQGQKRVMTSVGIQLVTLRLQIDAPTN